MYCADDTIWAPGGCERPYSCPERILKKGKSPRAYYVRKPEPIVVTFTREQMTITSIPGPDCSIKMADIKRLHLLSKGGP